MSSVYSFNPFGFLRALGRSSLFLSGGGSLIQDVTSNRSLWYYLWTIRTARRMRCRVMMYGCGIGPVRRRKNRERTERVLNTCVDLITLREDDSARELHRLGVIEPKILVTADPAISLSPAPEGKVTAFLAQHGIGEGEDYFILAPRPWRTMREHERDFAETARILSERHGLRPVLFAMQPETDAPICRRIAASLPSAVVLSAPPSGELTLGILKRAKLVVSVRLHTLIFAAGVGTPMVGVSYDPKVSGFLRYLGQENCPELQNAEASVLLDCAEKAMRETSSVAEKAETMRCLAQKNAALAAELRKDGFFA